MKCSKCNAEIADNAKFCPKCGAKVEKVEPVKNCPNCGEVLKEGAKFCAKCGCKIEKGNKCPQCGTELKVGAKFCPVCGTKIVSDIEEPPIQSAVCEQEVSIGTTSESMPVATSTRNTKGLGKSDKIIIIAAIVVFVVILITIIAVFLSSNYDSPSGYYSGYSYNYDYLSNSNPSRTFSNDIISFKYPDNYIVTNETDAEDEEDRVTRIYCEIKGDDISMISISYGEDEELYFYDDNDIKEYCELSLNIVNNTMESSMESNAYYGVPEFSKVSKKVIGNCNGYYSNYTVKASSHHIKGYSFIGVSGYFWVEIITQAENDKYMSQLDDILSTLDVKAIALGIGSMPDDDM